MSTQVVELVAEARLVVSMHRNIVMKVALRYAAADPLAVSMLFPAEYSLAGADYPAPPTKCVEWAFSRSLLAAGTKLASGIGDVRIRPVGYGAIIVELVSPDGVALLVFKACDLRDFLQRSYQIVPDGQEIIDLDTAIEEVRSWL